MYKILVVDDEQKNREFLSIYLKKEGYQVEEASDGLMALEMMRTNPADLLLLDIMMPYMNGMELSKELRKFSDVPIIFLTAVDDINTQIEGYEMGGDDYVTKPFSIKVVLAKVKRIFEKMDLEKGASKYQLGEVILDFEGRTAIHHEEEIKLAPKEWDLLLYLVENQGIALSRDRILEHVWGYEFEGESRVVDNHIKKIRKKLLDSGDCIQTVTTVGYKFERK